MRLMFAQTLSQHCAISMMVSALEIRSLQCTATLSNKLSKPDVKIAQEDLLQQGMPVRVAHQLAQLVLFVLDVAPGLCFHLPRQPHVLTSEQRQWPPLHYRPHWLHTSRISRIVCVSNKRSAFLPASPAARGESGAAPIDPDRCAEMDILDLRQPFLRAQHSSEQSLE